MDINRSGTFVWVLFVGLGLGMGWLLNEMGSYVALALLVAPVAVITVLKVSEEIFPLLLLFVLALGSSYDGNIANRSFYPRFGLLALITFRGMISILRGQNRTPDGHRSSTLVHWALFFLGLFGLIAAIQSLDPGVVTLRAFSFLMMFFVVFIYFWKQTIKPEQCEKFAVTLWWGLVWILGIGYLFLILRVPGMWKGGRLRLILGNPNQLGHYCALMAPIAVWFLFEKPRAKHWAWAWGAIMGILLSLILTASRGALLTVMFTVGLQFGLLYRKQLVSLVLISAFVGGAHYLMGDRAPQIGDESTYLEQHVLREDTLSTGSGRTEIWKYARQLIDRRPWFGYGFGSTDKLFEKGYFPDLPEFQGGHVHNGYLEELLNVGWIGALPLFLALAYLIFIGVAFLFKPVSFTRNYRLTVAFYAVVLAGVVSSTVESWLTSVGSVFCFPFWLAAALFLKMIHSFCDWRTLKVR